jgi:hypothetical protein
MVGRVLSELTGQRGPFILVIDDLHELNCPDALAQLTRLLTNLSGNVHAVLATRRDLPLRLHQLRLAGELAEIRAADLQFSERETCELLTASGIALSELAGGAGLTDRAEQGKPELLGVVLVTLHLHDGEPVRLPRAACPRTQQRCLSAPGRSRDDRYLSRRRAAQSGEKITPVDQPGSRSIRRQRPAFASAVPARHQARVRIGHGESP